jgi:hypothetical protein
LSIELAEEFHSSGQQIAAAPEASTSQELNDQLKRALGWPFAVARGAAYDANRQATAPFASIIFTRAHGEEEIPEGEPVNIAADRLACVIDVSHTLDLEGLRSAYQRVVRAKTLHKSPAAKDIVHTTITFGIVFAVTTTVPLERLAEELDRLNQQTPNAHWPDMVVVLAHGLITYAVQFPGEPTISGGFLPPAEGVLANYVPAIYIVMIVKPGGDYTFNQMMDLLLAHLAIFSPGAKLPDREAITKGVQNLALTQSSYEFNLAGELRPAPPEHYQGRYLPQRPFLVQDKKGEVLATLQFLQWQDGGVILLWGKFPLEGLMVFLGGAVLKKGGTIRREGLQISHVLPILEQNFMEMLQRIQRQTNMDVRNDPGKFVVQKLADEGASSPFMARLFIGILTLRDTLADSEKQQFEAAYHPLITTLLEIRATAKELADIYADHASKIAAKTIVLVQGPTIHIAESIDRPLAKKVDEFLSAATRSFKDKMQRVTAALGVNTGFLYQKPSSFERGVAALALVDAPLAAYLREARQWGDRLVNARNALEHEGWQLPRIVYTENAGSISVSHPAIDGQPVTEFVTHMTDRLMCFVEDVTVHCIQRHMPAGISITEIPSAERAAQMPTRFKPTLGNGGMPLWRINHHTSPFDAT